MYTRCLFCSRALGRNEALEAFPVGRRLAYDAAKGRLWVVCGACGRWNLTPLEERWEAIEQAERRYRGTRLRASTDNVGLARVADAELIRIGAPLRPEFAAWRYGRHIGVRRLRRILATGAALAVVGGAATFGIAPGVIEGGALLWAGWTLVDAVPHSRGAAIVARVPHVADRTLYVRRFHLAMAMFGRTDDGTPTLRVRDDLGAVMLTGEAVVRAAGLLLPAANRYGGARAEVDWAARYIERAGGPAGVLAGLVTPERRAARLGRRIVGDMSDGPTNLTAIPAGVRLALEMAVHEEQERRALEGELADLERAWRAAEEVAGVADSLALPRHVERAFARLRGRDGAA